MYPSVGSLLLGTTTLGTSATNTIGVLSGTAPTTSPADSFQMYSADQGAVAGRASVHFRSEEGTVNSLGYFNGFGYASGTALGARIDIKAQGALSTDIALRVRNSTDTANIFEVRGNGNILSRGSGNVSTNTAFGEGALDASVTGGSNTMFGLNTGTAITSGSENTFVGANAGFTGTILSGCTFIGRRAGFSTLSAEGSTFVGSDAGFNATSNYNTGLGYFALYGITSGGSNTGLGYNAGRYISDGVTPNSTGSDSVFIGTSSRSNANGQSNQIVIGHNAIGAGSNTATLGNTSIIKTILRGTLNAASLPTSAAGLVAGDIWNNSGVLNIV
jgi:hypothetical protein